MLYIYRGINVNLPQYMEVKNMEILKNTEKTITTGNKIIFLKYKLVTEMIDNIKQYGIILSERFMDEDDNVYCAPNFTDDHEVAIKYYNLIVDGDVTSETFYDIFEDFFVC